MKKVLHKSVAFLREWFDPALEGDPYVKDLEEKSVLSVRKNQLKLFRFQLGRFAFK